MPLYDFACPAGHRFELQAQDPYEPVRCVIHALVADYRPSFGGLGRSPHSEPPTGEDAAPQGFTRPGSAGIRWGGSEPLIARGNVIEGFDTAVDIVPGSTASVHLEQNWFFTQTGVRNDGAGPLTIQGTVHQPGRGNGGRKRKHRRRGDAPR